MNDQTEQRPVISEKDVQSAQAQQVEKPRICVQCGRPVDSCDDRFDMIGYDEDGKATVIHRNIKMVWSQGIKIAEGMKHGS